MRPLLICALLFVGCGGVEPVDPGQDAGTTKQDASTFACNPGEWFCEGTTIWSCTHEGHDAVIVRDCADYGASGYCGAPQCPSGVTVVGKDEPIQCCVPNP